MIISLKVTGENACDLGYLLHKNPSRLHEFSLNFGKAYVFYPEANDTACQATLLVEVDPIGLVRGKGYSDSGFALKQYVNDRPYVASSFLSVAISNIFGTALNGRCNKHPNLVDREFDFEIQIPAVVCRDDTLLATVFEPLGYAIEWQRHDLDPKFPEWGASRYVSLSLKKKSVLRDILSHLYVLLPVLDRDKHYWIGGDEIEKLLAKGEGWLASHPSKDLITKRYLKYRRVLSDEALLRLSQVEENSDTDETVADGSGELELEEKVSLHEIRLGTVTTVIKSLGANSILDLGCGEGRLVNRLMKESAAKRILGIDVSIRSLKIASDKLKLDRMPERQRQRLELAQGSLLYRDERFKGFDVAALVEVVEHLDEPRLEAMERVVFENARPGSVVVTTPNIEYNVKFETLPAGRLRHKDHRFEWTRQEFDDWANGIAERFEYSVETSPLGTEDQEVGAPSQMAIFKRKEVQ